MIRFARSLRVVLPSVAIALVAFAPQTILAQIGHSPLNSPYEDLKPTQDLTLFFGHFGSKIGDAGILPKPSIFGGLLYAVPVGGPASLTGRYTLIPSERRYLLPTNTAANRFLGTANSTTQVVDAGISLALTGRKTWHRLVPSLAGGVGLASSPAKADTGGYKFGTKFAFTYGANVRYVLRNGWGLRADATNYFWQITYPDSYAIPGVDKTAVLKNTAQRTGWKSNWALSAGLSAPIFR